MKYNHLNLPTEVTFATGKINYTYDAAGTRLVKKVQPSGGTVVTTDYISGFDYENNVLQTFPHSEGYVKNNAGQYIYHYIYKDHLGNNRLIYADLDKNGEINPATEIVEENNYYPFGLKHKGYNELPGNGYKYKYAGKEWNDELGLDFYDFGARNYDPALGRWMNVDPLAEKYPNIGGYVYVVNNPIYFIDPDGRWVKGAGLWRNLTSSDARIYAEDAAKNRPDAEVIKHSSNNFSVSYMNLHNDGNVSYNIDYYNGKKSNPYKSTIINVLEDTYANNSSDPTIGDYLHNYRSAASMTSDWATGEGANYRVFYNTSEAIAMKNAWRVNEARELFYSKNDPNASVTNYKGSFGLGGLRRGGLDAIEQFIGSYSLEIRSNGQSLQFSIFNTTSLKSGGYGILPEYERSTLKAGGNMRQLYIWTEPLKQQE